MMKGCGNFKQTNKYKETPPPKLSGGNGEFDAVRCPKSINCPRVKMIRRLFVVSFPFTHIPFDMHRRQGVNNRAFSSQPPSASFRFGDKRFLKAAIR